jgi:hypothetical protein
LDSKEHPQQLLQVLRWLREVYLRLNPSKCKDWSFWHCASRPLSSSCWNLAWSKHSGSSTKLSSPYNSNKHECIPRVHKLLQEFYQRLQSCGRTSLWASVQRCVFCLE